MAFDGTINEGGSIKRGKMMHRRHTMKWPKVQSWPSSESANWSEFSQSSEKIGWKMEITKQLDLNMHFAILLCAPFVNEIHSAHFLSCIRPAKIISSNWGGISKCANIRMTLFRCAKWSVKTATFSRASRTSTMF
jgi:hypothetical protein